MELESFLDQIVGLGLKECAPTEINIGEQRFDVVNFRWNENGFSLSFDKDSSIYDAAMQLLRSDRERCALKFATLSVNFDCFVKTISVDESNCRMSVIGSGKVAKI